MSTRSEFYEAAYKDGQAAEGVLRYEVSTAASFALCFAVFIGAIVVAWRKSPDALRRHAAMPLETKMDAREAGRE